jgi:CoA:oxalate CoA-transferase
LILEPADIWCAAVFNYDELMQQEGYSVLEMEQVIQIKGGWMKTTRCPIKIDGEIIRSARGAPILGEHTEQVVDEFGLKEKILFKR